MPADKARDLVVAAARARTDDHRQVIGLAEKILGRLRGCGSRPDGQQRGGKQDATEIRIRAAHVLHGVLLVSPVRPATVLAQGYYEEGRLTTAPQPRKGVQSPRLNGRK